LQEVYEFPNGPLEEDNHVTWDMGRIWSEIINGIRMAAVQTGGQVDSIGLDSWGADFLLVDSAGDLLGKAFCLRDPRNVAAMERAFTILPRKRIYEITGIQLMAVNTLYGLLAHIQEFPEEWERAKWWLGTAEYLLFRMTGVPVAEYTNAPNSQMLDAFQKTWSRELCETFGLDLDKFPPIVPPGTILGNLRPTLAKELGLPNTKVIAPACHDTGSAVAAIPFPHDKLAFISSGTWSLVGTVLRGPLVSDQGYEFNITNEGGVGNTIRYLRNVIGLWLFQECLREWNEQGLHLTAAQLASQCMDLSLEGPHFDVAVETPFLAPGNMVARVNAALRAKGFAKETRPAEVAAIIFRSLARRYAEVIDSIRLCTGKTLERLCIVGGGVRNEALNRLASQATGLEVVKGSSEATLVGNVGLQIAALENTHSLEQIQAIVSRLTYEDTG
jgi:rhamnulokinase